MPRTTPFVTFSLVLLAMGFLWPSGIDSVAPSNPTVFSTTEANRLLQQQPAYFVQNLGQWDDRARFVHRSGPMTLFIEDRGWVLDLAQHPVERKAGPHEPGSSGMQQAMPGDSKVGQKIRGVALKMTFEGDAYVPEIVGEKKLAGHHNYFLGNDESRWRTSVPLYGSVCYKSLYPGIDLRLRQANGVPEYDLLLQPGADLSLVTVHVEGAQDLSIASDGSLVIETALGPVTQSVPKTWQVGGDARKREVVCDFTLLGADRFGFAASGWDGDTSLTIDPDLIWSTFLGGSGGESAYALSVDTSGVVTVAGFTISPSFPTTSGAYDTTHNGDLDVFVSRLDPSKSGTAQLVYSTFLGGSSSLGGSGSERAYALSVDAIGVVTVAGGTSSANFPTTSGAYDTSYNGGTSFDVFVSRLDPRKSGTAQLVYSTFLGGSRTDTPRALSVDASGAVTVAGETTSTNFPTTSGAYDRSHNGRGYKAFISRLDPSKSGTAQLVYSTFLGGYDHAYAYALFVDASDVVMVVGYTGSTNFPTTSGAYDTTHNGGFDVFVSRLDPSKIGTAQLVYSTFLGGSRGDRATALSVAASGVVTVAGYTYSADFPTTSGAYDTTYNGGSTDAFVSRLDPSKSGTAQLVYSTFLGGSSDEGASALSVDASGVVTVAGYNYSVNFPTTRGAYDTTLHGIYDSFVSRLDPSKSGTAQLVYSTFLGGGSYDFAHALFVDASGVATVAGHTWSTNFPTTSGAYDTTHNGGYSDAFVSRLSMGAAYYRPFGGGCKGTFLAPPRLQATLGQTGPVAGQQFTANLSTFPPFRNGAMIYLGLSKTTWAGHQLPLDLKLIGVPGCNLYISPDFLFPMTGPSWTVSIPSFLIGLTFYNQALVFDPNANNLGFIVSNPAEAYVGSR